VQEKRTEIVTVRVSPSDLAHLKRAGEILWPGAPITKSSLLLGLACLKANELVKRKVHSKKLVGLATLLLFSQFAWLDNLAPLCHLLIQ
jgi:hypothetical protein